MTTHHVCKKTNTQAKNASNVRNKFDEDKEGGDSKGCTCGKEKIEESSAVLDKTNDVYTHEVHDCKKKRNNESTSRGKDVGNKAEHVCKHYHREEEENYRKVLLLANVQIFAQHRLNQIVGTLCEKVVVVTAERTISGEDKNNEGQCECSHHGNHVDDDTVEPGKKRCDFELFKRTD